MLSINQLREENPEELKDLCDKEVEELRDSMYKFAHLAFDQWCVDKGIEMA